MMTILGLSLVRIYFHLCSLYPLVCELHGGRKNTCLIYHPVTIVFITVPSTEEVFNKDLLQK